MVRRSIPSRFRYRNSRVAASFPLRIRRRMTAGPIASMTSSATTCSMFKPSLIRLMDITTIAPAKVGVPALFGTNFQSVSVGEKLAMDPVTGLKGGYTDVLGTPGQALAGELEFIDQSIGRFVAN